MKKYFLLPTFCFLILLSACTQETIPTYTIEQFLKTTSIGGGYFNPDETKLLVSSNETGIYNVYAIDISTGERTALTESETETVVAVAYMPEDERFLFTKDKGGNEINKAFPTCGRCNDHNIFPLPERIDRLRLMGI